MSGKIFAVKLMSFVHALSNTGVLATLAEQTTHYGLQPGDDKTRLALRSPEVLDAVCAKFGVSDCRVRLALPAELRNINRLAEGTMLEVYGVDKKPLTEPMPAISLPDDLANAMQVELLQLLLQAKGIDIPLL